MNGIFLVVAAYLASAIESVEMVAILVGLGVTRGWRSTWMGAAAAFVVLGGTVIGLGTALESIPIQWLRLGVGALLLIFGLQWLKKALIRLGWPDNRKKHKDEDAQPPPEPGKVDWYAFVVAFKGVLLEGLEIAFIVVTFGAQSHQIELGAIAAAAAFATVGGVAFLIRGWLSRIPREWLRFGVSVLLTTFGIYWSAEGAGVHWPGEDLSLLGLLGVMTGVAFGLLWLLRVTRPVQAPALETTGKVSS